MRTWLMGLLVGALCVMADSAMAAGARPAGLVLSYTGSQLELMPYTEVMANSEFDLGTETLSFVHYGTCKTIEVKGGRLKIDRDVFQADGVIRELEKDQCPEQVAIRTGGVGGGVLMRAALTPEVPPRLECVLAGAKSKDFSAIQVMDGSRVLIQMPLTGPKIALPAGMRPLRDGGAYRLNLVPGNPVEPSRSVTVVVSTLTGGKLCLLRID